MAQLKFGAIANDDKTKFTPIMTLVVEGSRPIEFVADITFKNEDDTRKFIIALGKLIEQPADYTKYDRNGML